VEFTLEQATKTQMAVLSICYFLNHSARWGGWSTSRPDRFTPR